MKTGFKKTPVYSIQVLRSTRECNKQVMKKCVRPPGAGDTHCPPSRDGNQSCVVWQTLIDFTWHGS
jgi:hypothetical protein